MHFNLVINVINFNLGSELRIYLDVMFTLS